MALSSQGVPGVVAGPSCGYAATKLATEKYGLGSGIVDAIRGQVDDWAEQKARDGTISGFLQALVIKTANYASKAYSATQCRDAFVEEHYGPQERWRRQIADIKAEPSRSLARCTELRRERAKLIAENAGFSQRGDNLSKQIDTAKKQLARLEQQSQAVNLVCR